jgi:ribosomal protein S18 acetylase RimI-like enzyme
MELRSLGYRTDLIFPAFEGQIVDRGDYLVVRTPANPTFYWGNFLLFGQPPGRGDFERWRELFGREIGSQPLFVHQAFGWDSPEGEMGLSEPFLQAGFEPAQDVVLTAPGPRPPARPSTAISVRPLSSASDREQALELQVMCRDAGHEAGGYRVFKRRSMDRYVKMSQTGRGDWYGAFIGEQLVADLGVFHDGQGLGRYRSVETHPDFRRQGIAGTLVYEAGRRAVERHGLHTLVIVAEENSAPARLYQSLGFALKEKMAGLLWWDRKAAGQQAT